MLQLMGPRSTRVGLEFCLDSCTINNLSYIGYMGLWVNSDSEANVCVLCAPSLLRPLQMHLSSHLAFMSISTVGNIVRNTPSEWHRDGNPAAGDIFFPCNRQI